VEEEKQESASPQAKSNRLPWIIISAVILLALAAVYFFVSGQSPRLENITPTPSQELSPTEMQPSPTIQTQASPTKSTSSSPTKTPVTPSPTKSLDLQANPTNTPKPTQGLPLSN
jgi:flagellar basal body-associated protein FliL